MESMTAYASIDFELEEQKLTMELKSVNHRYFEFKFKAPAYLNKIEPVIRNLARNSLLRGSVECNIRPSKSGNNKQTEFQIDTDLVEKYLNSFKKIQKQFGINGELLISDLLQVHNLFITNEAEITDELLQKNITKNCELCIEKLRKMQKAEGKNLKTAILSYIDDLMKNHSHIKSKASQLINEISNKIKTRLSELLSSQSLGEDRIMLEAGLIAQRLGVEEELERLESHFKQLDKAINDESGEIMGKKLDFILQEINRELNTIGSKSENTEVVYTVVESKTIAEKIREQIQNVK